MPWSASCAGTSIRSGPGRGEDLEHLEREHPALALDGPVDRLDPRRRPWSPAPSRSACPRAIGRPAARRRGGRRRRRRRADRRCAPRRAASAARRAGRSASTAASACRRGSGGRAARSCGSGRRGARGRTRRSGPRPPAHRGRARTRCRSAYTASARIAPHDSLNDEWLASGRLSQFQPPSGHCHQSSRSMPARPAGGPRARAAWPTTSRALPATRRSASDHAPLRRASTRPATRASRRPRRRTARRPPRPPATTDPASSSASDPSRQCGPAHFAYGWSGDAGRRDQRTDPRLVVDGRRSRPDIGEAEPRPGEPAHGRVGGIEQPGRRRRGRRHHRHARIVPHRADWC